MEEEQERWRNNCSFDSRAMEDIGGKKEMGKGKKGIGGDVVVGYQKNPRSHEHRMGK
jgi:hypothetical protein